MHDSAVASVRPAFAQEREHELGGRALVARDEVARVVLDEALPRARPRAPLRPAARTGRHGSRSRARRSSRPPRRRRRPRGRAPVRPPTPRRRRSADTPLRRRRTLEQPAQRRRLEHARPELLQLARRPRQRDGDAARRCSSTTAGAVPDEPGRRCRRPGSVACLRDAVREVRVGPLQALRDAAASAPRSRPPAPRRPRDRPPPRARAARSCGRRGSARARPR